MRHTLTFLEFGEVVHIVANLKGLEAAHSIILSFVLSFSERLFTCPDETDGQVINHQFAVAMCYLLTTKWLLIASVKGILTSRSRCNICLLLRLLVMYA